MASKRNYKKKMNAKYKNKNVKYVRIDRIPDDAFKSIFSFVFSTFCEGKGAWQISKTLTIQSIFQNLSVKKQVHLMKSLEN